MSASVFALPCSRISAGSKPADSAIASSPADATSQPSPSCGEDPRDRRAGAAPWRRSGRACARGGRANARRYSRAVSRSPASSTTKAGVPNSAATSASAQPPIASRPSARGRGAAREHVEQAHAPRVSRPGRAPRRAPRPLIRATGRPSTRPSPASATPAPGPPGRAGSSRTPSAARSRPCSCRARSRPSRAPSPTARPAPTGLRGRSPVSGSRPSTIIVAGTAVNHVGGSMIAVSGAGYAPVIGLSAPPVLSQYTMPLRPLAGRGWPAVEPGDLRRRREERGAVRAGADVAAAAREEGLQPGPRPSRWRRVAG